MFMVMDDCPIVTWTANAFESWMRELGKRVSTISRSTVKRRVIADTDGTRLYNAAIRVTSHEQ